MIIQVGNLYATLASHTPGERRWLSQYLRFSDPTARFRSASMKDKHLRMFDPMQERFPTGFLPLVLKAAAADDVRIEVLDRRRVPCGGDEDADLDWLRDYQRAAVDRVLGTTTVAPRERGIWWLPTGCLTGDTRIIVNRGGSARPCALSTIVAQLAGELPISRHGGRPRHWDLSIPTYAQSIDADGYVRKNGIVRGWRNGVAEVFELVTDAGHVIHATAGHRFMTDSGGFVELKDLRPRDRVMVAAWPTSQVSNHRRCFYEQQPHMRNHPYVQITNSAREGKVFRVPSHRLIAEAGMNGLSLAEFVGRILLGQTEQLTFLDPAVWAVHHIDGDKRNNSASNLEVLSVREHSRVHGIEGNWKNVTGRTVPALIGSITRVGEEQTYDLGMSADVGHNYVANEFVVHNSGKTECAIGLALALPCKWLLLVHRSNLMQQAADRYELRTGEQAGRVGEGGWQGLDRRFVSATFQTVHAGLRKKDPRAVKLLGECEGFVVDEGHTLPAGTFWKTAMSTPKAYWRIAMSGTPLARGDRKSVLSIAATGPVIYRVRADALIEAGVLAKPRIRMVPLDQSCDNPTWQGVYGKAVVRSAPRNDLLARICKKAAKPCLLFVKEIAHGHEMVRRLGKLGLRAEFTSGVHSSEWRKNLIKALERDALDVLVASVVLQEGVDIPGLESIVVGAGGKSTIATLQRLGRGTRTDQGRKTEFELWDIKDRGNAWLVRHTRARTKAYLSEGFEVIEAGL